MHFTAMSNISSIRIDVEFSSEDDDRNNDDTLLKVKVDQNVAESVCLHTARLFVSKTNPTN